MSWASAAHIFGGTVPEFRALAEACANWTLIDRQAGIKAVWDDESYLQRCAACPTLFQTVVIHVLQLHGTSFHSAPSWIFCCAACCAVCSQRKPAIVQADTALLSVTHAGISRSTRRR